MPAVFKEKNQKTVQRAEKRARAGTAEPGDARRIKDTSRRRGRMQRRIAKFIDTLTAGR